MSFEKTVLKEGLGLQRPNWLSSVLVDVVGTWTTPDGDDVTFERREHAIIQLGEPFLAKSYWQYNNNYT